MKMHARLWLLSALTFALGGWLLVTAGKGNAQGDDEKELREGVLKIADALQKNDFQNAKKQAEALAPKVDDLEEVMSVFSLRTKKGGGVGLGPKPGAITPDGIEKKLMDLSEKELTQKEANAQADALVRAGYIAAAVADVVHDKCPVSVKMGDKDPKDWKKWSEQMRAAALEFAEASKTKRPVQIKAAANKLNDACVTCHKPFREN